MTSPEPAAAPTVHYRIFVYDGEPPPLGEPTAVSLCPNKRALARIMTSNPSEVTCEYCRVHILTWGLDWV